MRRKKRFLWAHETLKNILKEKVSHLYSCNFNWNSKITFGLKVGYMEKFILLFIHITDTFTQTAFRIYLLCSFMLNDIKFDMSVLIFVDTIHESARVNICILACNCKCYS